jgi:hypothetical protein
MPLICFPHRESARDDQSSEGATAKKEDQLRSNSDTVTDAIARPFPIHNL